MVEGEGNKVLALKPMNCPGMFKFSNKVLNHKDLPIRCQSSSCHRNESSGALHGIMSKAFTQDDAHIFCTDTNNTRIINFL